MNKLKARLLTWLLRFHWFQELFFDSLVGLPVREQRKWMVPLCGTDVTEEQIQTLLRELEEKRLRGE